MVKAENSKAIILDDPEACLLVKRRAIAEERSARKALAITVKEALKQYAIDNDKKVS